MLSLPDKWVWDFWFAQNGDDYHIFYLQAPKKLKIEQYRHHNANIGHAVSQNLIDWEILPDALTPGSEGSWDDLATWTGCTVQHESMWYMFYTGVNRNEDGLIQRIGLATSEDLISWKKHLGNPIIEADKKFYELYDSSSWKDQAWRDPWVFKFNGSFHAFITGRVNYGPLNERGVIAHAESMDLINWNIKAPVTKPGEFGQLEIPQLIHVKNKYYLIFNTYAVNHSRQRLERTKLEAVTGTHYMVADHAFGPFKYVTDHFIMGDKIGTFYNGRMIQSEDGKWRMMACRNFSDDGEFVGIITNPFEVDFIKE